MKSFMKYSARSLFIAIIVAISYGVVSAGEANIDSLLTLQKIRAGGNGENLFSILNMDITPQEKEYAEFLLAYMPLSDLASLRPNYLLENIRYAIKAKETFSWGAQLNDNLFKHFVLPYRCAQEPAQRWRKPFFEELSKRVSGMTMTEAALEVNLWCYEHATFKSTKPWDQGPLTTIKAGFGRCEEEMILTISALRSVGIPARACFTPYWAHCDNNHAWVEVWADGKWSYMGGCEPTYKLGKAWFTNPAKRAALVVSTAFGDYNGDEEVLKKGKRSTIINSTSIYEDSKRMIVKISPNDYLPVDSIKVYFMLINYAGLLPLTSLKTDEKGVCSLTTGLTDWVVWAGSGDTLDWARVPAAFRDTVYLSPKPISDDDWSWSLDMHPPPPPENVAQTQEDKTLKELLRKKKAYADTLREMAASVWSDSERIDSLSKAIGMSYEDVDSVMQRAKGNWMEVFDFLSGLKPNQLNDAETFLGILMDKDLRSVDTAVLEDHFTAIKYKPEKSDSSVYNRFLDYILQPRIRYEHITAWRSILSKAFPDVDIMGLDKYLSPKFTIEESRDRFSAQLSPDEIYTAMRGTKSDYNHLIVAIIRAKGIPSRLHPITGQPQFWNDGDWKFVYADKDKVADSSKSEGQYGVLTLEYPSGPIEKPLCYRHWSLSKLDNGIYEMLEDFDYLSPIQDNEKPKQLPPGRYMLCGANRLAQGDVLAYLQFFTLNAGDSLTKRLIIRAPQAISERNPVIIPPPARLVPLKKWSGLTTFDELPPNGLIMVWVEPNVESSERVLDELNRSSSKLSSLGADFLLITDSYPGEAYLNRITQDGLNWRAYIDPGNAQLIFYKTLMDLPPSSAEMPFVIAVDGDGILRGYSRGLRFGISDDVIGWFKEKR